MGDLPRYASLRDYLRVIREQRWMIVIVTLAFAGAALAVSLREDPVYSASASLSFEEPTADFDLVGGPAIPTQTPDQRAATQAQVLTRPEVAQRVKEELEYPGDILQLLNLIDVQAEARTNLVVVTARFGDATSAARLANEFAEQARRVSNRDTRRALEAAAETYRESLPERVAADSRRALENNTTRAVALERINRLETLAKLAAPASIASPATVPTEPVSPQPVRNTTIGLLLGLLIGGVVAFVRDSLDRRFRSSSEISGELKLPLVGHVHDDLLGRTVLSVNGRSPFSDAELEAFRIMRTNVDFLDVDAPPRIIVVTSALPEEGKSTVSAALAAAYVAAGKRTLLVECDLRRPTVAQRFGLAPTPGLTDYLAGSVQPHEVLQTVPVGPRRDGAPDDRPELVAITAGTMSPRPAELLGSNRFGAFLEEVREAYDVVLLDTAPLLSVVDTRELLPRAEGILVCVRASQTTREQARAAKAALEHLPHKPTGAVITGMRPGDDVDYGYYSYAYAYGAPDQV